MQIETNNKAIFKEKHARNGYFTHELDAVLEYFISYENGRFVSGNEDNADFADMLNNEIAHKKVSVTNYFDKDNNTCEIMTLNDKPFIATRNKKLVSLSLYKTDSFCYDPAMIYTLEHLYAFRLQKLPHYFEPYELRTAYLPACTSFAHNTLDNGYKLRKLYVPNLERIDGYCLRGNIRLTELVAPKLKFIGDAVLNHNKILNHLDISNVEYIGDTFLYANRKLQQLYIPKCKYIGNLVLVQNQILNKLDVSGAVTIGYDFLKHNQNLTKFVAPKLSAVSEDTLADNNKLQKIYLDSCETIAKSAFANKPDKTHIYAPCSPKEYLTITDSLNTLFIQESMNKKAH